MITTNPRNFRAELRIHLDQARHQPIRITRRSKESFILMNEQKFAELNDEVVDLQRRLLESMQGQFKSN